MEQLLDGLFRVLDPRAVLAIILLRFELLQEAEARRSGRVPGSAVLCHAETLLAAVRHLITNANSAAHFLHPRAATGGQASWRRKDSPDHHTARGFERGQRRPGMGEIPSFPGRAQDGHRAHDCRSAWGPDAGQHPLSYSSAPSYSDGARDTRPKPAMARPKAGTVVSSV